MSYELHEFSVEQLSNAFCTREVSPVELTHHLLSRIERLNGKLNALYYLDPEMALQKARASEQRYMSGTARGLFDGIPTSIKDALPAVGMPTYRGSASNQQAIFYDWNAPAVDRLIEAGAVIQGKNTMCDFGIIASGISSRHGITRNPWNSEKTPGGSSSGAASSVAAGFCPAILGTDIVGSIRLPASYCGLVGLKPSYGRVPYYLPNSPALVAGPIARTVRDVAAMLDVISQPDRRDFTALEAHDQRYLHRIEDMPRGRRCRLITNLGFGIKPDEQVVKAVYKAASQLERHGVTIEEYTAFSFPADLISRADCFYRARTYAELNQAAIEDQKKSMLMFDWTRSASKDSGEDIVLALQALLALRERAYQLLGDYDFLLLPSTPTTAFAADQYAPDGYSLFDAWCNTFLFNLTEQPALSVNCGHSSDGMPIGLQIVGKRFDDLGVLQMGRYFEQIHGQPYRMPLL